ncbi:MAG TPA: hypothetical protein VEB21_19515, partial [Terriglobales bacterium]|nr:hypothetical protein [Terriglobales bacterium]
LAPIVGQQITRSSAAGRERSELLQARADTGECDLVVSGYSGGRARSWLYAGQLSYLPDEQGQAADAEEIEQLASEGTPLTYTCVPPGSGTRIGLDRDQDGFWNGDEVAEGSDPADPSSFPGAATPIPTATPTATAVPPTATPRAPCLGDCDGSEAVTVDELVHGVNLALGAAETESCPPFDGSRDGSVTVDELLGAIRMALEGCPTNAMRSGECQAYAQLRRSQ